MNATQQSLNLLNTRQHFEILDGLRGVAAVAVVVFHFMEIAIPDAQTNFIAHGYLAVDFFFCLSGFVIAYAYDNRIEKIGLVKFIALRLIRLHPLVVIGSVIGLLAFVFDPFSNLYAQYGAGKTLLMFLTSCLMIPYPIVSERYSNLFHLNAPAWSLFWEYIANIFYAMVLVKLTHKSLFFLTILAAFLLCYTAYSFTNLVVGWSLDTVMGGGARVFYSFLAGMLVYRSNWIIKSSLGFIPISALLVLAFLFPYSDKINWITEPLLVIFYFPLLVALGAGAHLRPSLKKICVVAGEISYPLYMTHYPFLWIFLSYTEAKKTSLGQLETLIPWLVLLLIGFAFVVMRYVDIPIRKYLRKNLQKSILIDA